MIISHEILEIKMTDYVPAVSLKVFGGFSSDLEIFKDSEWMYIMCYGIKREWRRDLIENS